MFELSKMGMSPSNFDIEPFIEAKFLLNTSQYHQILGIQNEDMIQCSTTAWFGKYFGLGLKTGDAISATQAPLKSSLVGRCL